MLAFVCLRYEIIQNNVMKTLTNISVQEAAGPVVQLHSLDGHQRRPFLSSKRLGTKVARRGSLGTAMAMTYTDLPLDLALSSH